MVEVKKREEAIFLSILLLFCVILLYASIPLRSDVRLFPLLVLVPMSVMILLQLAAVLNPKIVSALRWILQQEAPRNSDVAPLVEFKIFASVFVLFIAFWFFGVVISTTLYLLLFLRLSADTNWKSAIGVTIGTLAFNIAIFHMVCGMNLWYGLITNRILALI